LSGDLVIAEPEKNPLEKLCASLREYRGHSFVDIRLHFLGDETWYPTNGPDIAALLNAEGVATFTGQGCWYHGMLPRLLQPIETKDQTPMRTEVC
jgi:hypothetical protein